MTVLLLLASVTADPVTWAVPSRQLEGGGQVELVAVGDDAGSWWTPSGEPIPERPFKLLPNYLTEKAREEGRETNFDADPDGDQIERVFVVRVLNAEEDARIDVRSKTVRDPKVAKDNAPTSIGVSHVVSDPEGETLPGWKAKADVFFRGNRPTGAEVIVQHGPWLHELTADPQVISQEEHDRNVEEGRAIELKQNGTAAYRLEVIARDDGRARLSFMYRDEDVSRAGRFVVRFTDGETLTSGGGTGVVGQTYVMYQTLTPLDRGADEIESIDIELQAADVVKFEDVAIHPKEK